MLNVIFVSDDTDAIIGRNCAMSHDHFIAKVDLTNDNVVLLNGNRCTAAEVEASIATFNGRKFILAAYSHGCEDALVSNAEHNGYVHAANTYFFGSSIVYTNSCYTGLKLKQHLIDAGCCGYVGYDDEVRLPRNESDQLLFIACENSGLIHFLNSQDSLSKSIDVMKADYQTQYNSLINNNKFVLAALLKHNMDCLTFHDDGSLSRSTLEN